MTRMRPKLLLAAATVVVTVAGCGSSGSAPSKPGTDGVGKTVTIGVLTDVTGAAASGNKTAVQGVKAGTYYAHRAGYTIKYVVGDTATSPSGALSTAQKMVTQDHVLAVVAHSALTFSASAYLTSHGVPVIGPAQDGPEWITAKNMFGVGGAFDFTKVTTTAGKFFKDQGVTNLASVGYEVSPASSEEAKGVAQSAQAAGVKVGYLNAKFPFGSTNVGPEVLAMKSAGIDGFVAEVDPNTSFAMISSLRDQGVSLKAVLLPTGYGGDLTESGQGAIKAAQNVFFAIQYEPVEMGTAATKQFAADLRSAGVTGAPTYAEYNGYASVALLVEALDAAGASPTRASLLQALSGVHDFGAAGLYGGHKIDINDRKNVVAGTGCLWITKFEGSAFKLVTGAEPICGDVIQGVTVSP